jgi:hypothetical protein
MWHGFYLEDIQEGTTSVGGSSGISPEALLGLRTESQQTVGYET